MSNAAQQIRNDIKAAGYSLKAFSIRTRSTGSVTIAIKDAAIPADKIKGIARKHEVVRRCDGSGEILSGGNTFISIGYEAGVLSAAGNKLAQAIEQGERTFAGLHISEDRMNHYVWTVWTNGPVGHFVRQISRGSNEGVELASVLAERGELSALETSGTR